MSSFARFAMQAAGLLGATLVLVAYLSLQRGWLSGKSVGYHALNFAGAGLLVTVALLQGTAGFIVLNGVWTVIAVLGIRDAIKARRAQHTHTPSLSPEYYGVSEGRYDS